MNFAVIKSKANNVDLENSPETKVAKYTKLLREGILTQEEYEEKIKQAISIDKPQAEVETQV